MELSSTWSGECMCGRTFTSPSGYTNHQRGCSKTKKRLSSCLEKAREALSRAKKRRKTAIEQPDSATAHSQVVEEAIQSEARDSKEVAQVEDNPSLAHFGAMPANDALLLGQEQTGDLPQSLAECRTRRKNRQLPKRYRDIAPEPPAALPPPSLQAVSEYAYAESHESPSHAPPVRQVLTSTRNMFGLFRQYYATRFPDHDPEAKVTSDDLSMSSDPLYKIYAPYPNQSSFLLGEWYWNGGEKKSQSGFQNLLKIVGHPDFRPEDVAGKNWRIIDSQLSQEPSKGPSKEDEWEDDDDSRLAGWTKTPIKINVPFHKRTLQPGPKEFNAGFLHHRKLMSVITERITRPSIHPHLHFEPYKLFWQPGGSTDSEPVRVHGELYTSEAFIEAHNELQDSPPEPGCDLPRVVLGLMFASDGTQLTTFSSAKLWPVYLTIGNESKNRRSKPSCHAFEHVAYLETLPDTFTTFAAETMGKAPNAAFMGHCHREMYHAQWSIILDDEFLEAYGHGIVIKCCDDLCRRFYPRVFTHSADYKEKILIVGIRNLGGCPCPRCLIPMDRVPDMGLHRDLLERVSLVRVDDVDRRNRLNTARKAIYEKNNTVDGVAVENLLKEDSLLPAANAFSDRLSPFRFNMFRMLVVDLLHEFEIGVWKAVFIHLLRLLDCLNEKLKHELDRRFREVPPFGADGVRKITTNRSELKKMTAHDYEDMLQCAIPVFDGLLPEPHNTLVLRLLFDLAHWHGLAKLRMHTDSTLEVLSQATIALGTRMREFQATTCTAFTTHELERERAARVRRQEKNAATAKAKTNTQKSSSGRQPKQFNLRTYKYHALGDYCDTIRRFGTTDSYSTQSSEREHRTAKGRFLRTSGRLIPQQLSRIEQRQRRIRMIREKLNSPSSQIESEDVTLDLGIRYNMGTSQKFPVHIPTFLQRNQGDPAIKNFYAKLREHLLPRVQTVLQTEVASCAELNIPSSAFPLGSDKTLHDFIFFNQDSIYQHKIIRFNFTTYDVQRGTDVVKPEGPRCNIMLLADHHATYDSSPSDSHPFLYASVLGAYHANVIYTGPGMRDYKARPFHFLWVRWYEVVDTGPLEWKNSTLDFVRFPPLHKDGSFGFVDPADVLRGCHILPAFAKGKRVETEVNVSCCAKDSKDYQLYYVGRFSDRDLLMRYHWGLGVGHFHAHQFSSSCKPSDITDDPILEQGSKEEQISVEDDIYHESDNLEMTLEDREFEGWEDVESDESRDADASDDQGWEDDDY